MELIKQDITDYLAIIISVITFVTSYIFTWRTTDRFGLRSKIYEKKLEVCLQLIELIKGYKFYHQAQTKRNEISVGGMHITKGMNYFESQYNMFKDIPLFIDKDAYDKIFRELSDVQNSPYLDMSIVESLAFLDTKLYFASNQHLSMIL